MSDTWRLPWPVLTEYDSDHLGRIALPLGGIGTGTISLGGRGDLRDWEIVNRPAKGFTPSNCFFALWTETQDGETVTRALEGPLDASDYEGSQGSTAKNHGLPRFRQANFKAAYPFGQLELSDPDVPVSIRLEAFNPLIPPDEDRSGLPVAILRYVISNPTASSVKASICANIENFVGDDGFNQLAQKGRNRLRNAPGINGILLTSEGVPKDAETYGTIGLAVLDQGRRPESFTHRTSWARLSWGNSILDYWDDFSADGALEDRPQHAQDERPIASLASTIVVPAQSEASVTFLITWHFPNRQSWSPNDAEVWLKNGECAVGPPTIGNWYSQQFKDAWAVALRVAEDLPELEADTLDFVQSVCELEVPNVVKEAALYNLSTLRSQTVFRTPDGILFGFEGCHDHHGSCLGSCTHVWNYENATPFLFGKLARSMREVEFKWATKPDTGHMSFRVHLPLNLSSPNNALAAADGQMGCLMKLYRDWKLCGDDDWLRTLWPQARKALEFCWIPGGWDADRDGVMEGCQHNTMDVEYYGPNPQMGAWYLGALRAMQEMATHLGEPEFADECQLLFENGSHRMDEDLFNGDYYEHHIMPASGPEAIAEGIRHTSMGADNLAHPELQLGAGCLIDQLVGQYMAHVCGLGYLLNPNNIRQTLLSVLRFNRRQDIWGHFNQMRSYVLGDETAILMASFPQGNRPLQPFPYCNEAMTGFEHQLAAHLIYEGFEPEGVEVISDIRERYDGKRRSPFDEAECGHHYARAMAAWTHILALTGFQYDAHQGGHLTFSKRMWLTPCFWSTGEAWGTIQLAPTKAHLKVHSGRLRLSKLTITGVGSVSLTHPRTFTKAETHTFDLN